MELFAVERSIEGFQSINFDTRVSDAIETVANCDDYDEIWIDKLTKEEGRMNQLNAFQYRIDTYLKGEEIHGHYLLLILTRMTTWFSSSAFVTWLFQ